MVFAHPPLVMVNFFLLKVAVVPLCHDTTFNKQNEMSQIQKVISPLVRSDLLLSIHPSSLQASPTYYSLSGGEEGKKRRKSEERKSIGL